MTRPPTEPSGQVTFGMTFRSTDPLQASMLTERKGTLLWWSQCGFLLHQTWKEGSLKAPGPVSRDGWLRWMFPPPHRQVFPSVICPFGGACGKPVSHAGCCRRVLILHWGEQKRIWRVGGYSSKYPSSRDPCLFSVSGWDTLIFELREVGNAGARRRNTKIKKVLMMVTAKDFCQYLHPPCPPPASIYFRLNVPCLYGKCAQRIWISCYFVLLPWFFICPLKF